MTKSKFACFAIMVAGLAVTAPISVSAHTSADSLQNLVDDSAVVRTSEFRLNPAGFAKKSAAPTAGKPMKTAANRTTGRKRRNIVARSANKSFRKSITRTLKQSTNASTANDMSPSSGGPTLLKKHKHGNIEYTDVKITP